uniref:YhdP family protein n=1 Tax=uncultured Campylobacter sp. TaxID=218934 RepID=UPI002633DCD8
PVEQLSGKTDAKLALDIKFDPLEVTPKGKFKITGGQTLIAGAKFNVDTADVELLNDKLKVNAKNTGMDFFSADAAVNLDLGKLAGDINGTLKGLNLAFGKSEILKLGATPFAAKLDFSGKDTKLDIALPAAVSLKFGAQNEINLPDAKSLLPYSPLLKSLQISEGGVNIKTKDFENLSIEANGVKFETPLFKKDGSPYDADSFAIDVNANGATGKSKSGGLNFKISGGKTELFIKELDLALSGDENLTDKDGDIEFEAKGSKLILNDFNATLDLLAYSGQSTDGTVRFDAKPARGNFSLIKSDKKFEMWANDIRGEFINSIFNIKSFEGGSFKMRVLGSSTDDFKGEVRLIGATLKDYTFYNQLLTFLNSVPSLLVFKTPDFGADGYPVKFGKILFEKKGDVLKFLAIELESSSADIGGHGTINLATKEIDVDLELKLLKDASSIIDKIPLINQIVLGKDRTLSTVIKVRGTLQKPQYSTQILQDALLSPFKIIRNVLEAPFLIFE